MENRLPILIISFDGFKSLWNPCVHRVKKYAPFLDIYLMTTKDRPSIEKVKVLPSEVDMDWSSNLRFALNQIDSEYLMLIMDDVFIDSEINEQQVLELVGIMERKGIDYINLKSTPTKFIERKRSDLVRLPVNRMYRTAVVPTIWKKSTLLDLLRDGETAWQFEIRGSDRSRKYERFYVLPKPLFCWIHVIVQGKLTRKAERQLKKYELDQLDFEKMNFFENLKFYLKSILSDLSNELPFELRSKIRKVLIKKWV
jgi:hypothetical protein